MRLFLLALLSLCPAALHADEPAIKSKVRPDLHRIPLEKLYTTRNTSGGSFSPDGKRIAFTTNITGRINIWTVPAEGGWPVQLTISDQRQTGPVWSPDGKWIAFQSDHDGDEQWDLFLAATEGGEVTNLTGTRDISEEEPVFSPDGRRLAYAVKPRTGSSHEIYMMDLGTRTAQKLTSDTKAEYGNHGPHFSPDGRWLAYSQVHASEKDASIYLLELATKKTTLLTPHKGENTYYAAGFSPDGQRLLIESNARDGYTNVALLDIKTQKITWLTQDKGEVNAGGISPDGKQLSWVRNNDGNFEVFLYDIARGKATALPLPPGINGLGAQDQMGLWSHDGSRLMFHHSGPDRPGDVWVYDMRKKGMKQVTDSLVGGLRSEDLVQPYLVHYPTFDGRKISAFLYLPYNLAQDHKNPGVVFVHGGPTGQSVNGFNRPIQYLVNRGYVVIAPNYRGSTGYGKEFQDLNRMDMGGGDLKDVVQAAEFLKGTGYVNPARVALLGGSYGGYMTMMGVTKTPQVWAAGVAIVPFVNWFTEVKNEDPQLQQYDLSTMGDPVKDKALWEDRSPINFIDKIRAPLLLLAGGNDPRCPHTEADQVAAAIRKRNGVVEYKVYENEGHSFARIENQIDAFQRVARFLDQHLQH